VVELVRLIEKTPIVDLSLFPTLSFSSIAYPWRVYAPFLKGLGLVVNKSGVLSLTDIGLEFYNLSSQKYLASLLHDRYRLFGETLELLESSSKTVEEVDKELCREYCLDWANLNNTRRRMDWLEVLGLIQSVGNRKWGLTQEGKELLEEWPLIRPDVIDTTIIENEDISILPPPAEICELLTMLKEDASLHKRRNTYNIWVPSPNRIENLRTIVQFSLERVSRADLFKFIEEEYNLKTSSVESMMPFLKADGLLEEVGRNIYVATPAAKAWCDSGNDLDFIRILHSHKRFVGEMIVAAENAVTRNEIYVEAKKYGINTEKARWIMGFLLEAGLLEETQYLHVKATQLGMALSTELPLMEAEFEEQGTTDNGDVTNDNISEGNDITTSESNALFDALCVAARNPVAEGKASGVAFEENIAGVFRYMGFDAKRIGGAGNTDVVVRWKDGEGKTITAIVDGKSKSNGTVTHNDISDVAIETHKEKNNADYVAIVGPGFSGDTIKNHARKKGFSLVTDVELVDIALKSQALGLALTEISLLFKVPNGLSQLNELMITRKRELEIITLVITTFKQEQDAMDSLSARDLYFLLRRTSISPSLEELINAFELLSKEEIGVLTQIKKDSSAENTTYSIHGETQSVNRLRALATAIENGM
jgi:type III secretion system FlhB-like substrate exporter